ncbi:hypothetical protein RI367_004493 [Sorochytrium milnesiophthora]
MSHPAPAPALAPAPAPAPGEAHAPPAIGVQDHGNGDLYRLTFMPVLRTSVRQQTTTATTLDAWEVECDGVDSLARLLWQRFEGHLRNRAVSDNSVEPATWSMSAVAPTIRDIDKYLAVERSSRKYVIAEVNSVLPATAALLQPPPPHIILLFTRAPGNPEQHMRQLRDSMSFARDVLDSSKANLQSLRQSLVDTMGRLEGFQRVLDVQERALVAFETMIGPLQRRCSARRP